MKTNAFRFQTSGPADVKQLEEHMDRGSIKPEEVVCIIGKTEGNGGRNDFTRDLAMTAFEDLFARRLGISREEVTDRIIFSLSGGCEGVVSPHIVVFTVGTGSAHPGNAGSQGSKRLAIATGFTRDFRPDEIGRMPQVEETARVIRELVAQLKVESNADVHFVQMKGAIPNYTFDQAQSAEAAGKPIRSDMVYSRAASALGAALALGEVPPDKLTDSMICRDWNQYSGVASCSAKPGLTRTEIMVMANSPHWEGDLAINHGVLNDMLDTKTVRVVLEELGIKFSVQPTEEQIQRIVAVFAKSEADPRGTIRGKRHTMLTDDDISDTRYSRCILGAVIASVIGDTSIYISTRAEHHGPLGGGTIAIIARQV
jgi:cyanuric acid amidohydrolase